MLASSSKHVLNANIRTSVKAQTLRTSRSVNILAGSSQPRTPVHAAWKSTGHDRNQDSSRLQSRPWSFDRDNRVQFHQGSPTVRYNMQLQARTAAKNSAGVLELAAQMKEEGVRPDLTTYNIILNALGYEMMHQEAWAVFRDMLAVGIEPDVQTFNSLIYAVRFLSSDQLHNVLREMERHGLQLNSKTYDNIISYYLEGDNLEVALTRLAEMNDLGLAPSLRIAQLMVQSAAETGHVRLALELAEAYEESSVRRLDNETWVKLLVSCAESLYADGVQRCWAKAVRELGIMPDEGLCQAVLHTAGRHGIPTLAAEAINHLESLKVKFREHHLSPMLDAFVRNGQIKEAFRVLELMRSSGITPTLDAARSILQAIQRDPDTIDGAYALLEELHKEGQKVDVVAVNVIIEASSFINDLQRAVGSYKAMPSLDLKPNVETFNLLLSACRQAKHFELGNRLFSEMKDAGLKPSIETYASVISLTLTQTDYENAFFYLEEMKAQGFTPPYAIYEDIVQRCVFVGDSRYKLAVEELEQMGYKVSSGLQSFIDSGGQEWKEKLKEEEMLPFSTRKGIREARQKLG